MEEEETNEYNGGHMWNDMEIEVTELESEHTDIAELHIDHFELDFTGGSLRSADKTLLESHFPALSNKVIVSEAEVVDFWLLGKVAVAPLVALFIAVIVARRCAPTRTRTHTKRKSANVVRQPDICTTLQEVCSLPPEERVSVQSVGYQRLCALSQTFYHLACSDHAQIESVLRDQGGCHSNGLPREDALDGIIRQVGEVVRVLEGAVRECKAQDRSSTAGKRGRKLHIEDRLDAHDCRVALSAVLMNYACVKEALRETAVLSVQRHIQASVARLRKAIEHGDVSEHM